MIYCANCGTGNRDGSRFCNECGQPLGEYRACPLCEGLNHRTSRFCSQCGSKLDAPATVPPPAPPAPAPGPIFTDAFASAVHASAEDLPLEVEAPDLAALLADPPTIVTVPPEAAPPRPEFPAAADHTGAPDADEWSDLMAAIESTADLQATPQPAAPAAGERLDFAAAPDAVLPMDLSGMTDLEAPPALAAASDVAGAREAGVPADTTVAPGPIVPEHPDGTPDFTAPTDLVESPGPAAPDVTAAPEPELALAPEPAGEQEAAIPSEPAAPRLFASPTDADLMAHPTLEAPPVSPNGVEPSSEDVLASTWLASAAEPSLPPELTEPDTAPMGEPLGEVSLAGNPLFAIPPESGLTAEMPALDVALSPEELPNWLDSTQSGEAQEGAAVDSLGASVRPFVEPGFYPRPTVQVVAGISLAHSGRAGLSPSPAVAPPAPKPRVESLTEPAPVAAVVPPAAEAPAPKPKEKGAGGRSYGWIVVVVVLLVLLGAVAVAYQAGYLSPDLFKLP